MSYINCLCLGHCYKESLIEIWLFMNLNCFAIKSFSARYSRAIGFFANTVLTVRIVSYPGNFICTIMRKISA